MLKMLKRNAESPQRIGRRLLAVVTLLAWSCLVLAGSATAAMFTLSDPIAITGAEAGNPGVVGSINPELDLSGSVDALLSAGVINFATQDVFVVRVVLSTGSSAVDQIGIGVASTPIIPNPWGAGTFSLDAGQAPDGVTAGTFTTLSGIFDFDFNGVSDANLQANEMSRRLFVTYQPLDSALAVGATANFMISSATNFTVQGTLIPEPSTALLLGGGLLGMGWWGRRRR